MKARREIRRALLHSLCMRAFGKIRMEDLDAKGAIYEAIEAKRFARRQRSPWYERE